MNITKTQILTYTIILLTGMILGWLIFGGSYDHIDYTGHDHAQQENGSEVWTCSMHPSVRSDEPGSCPICGMDLIPVSSEEREDDFTMVMTEAVIRLANIQTTPVIRDLPKKEIILPGRIAVDERRISYVTAHFEGRIHDVKIDFTGAPIRQGEVMATIYSQEVVSAQRELLEAYRNRERNPGMYQSAMRKFRLWEFTDEQIQQIIERGEVQTHMEIMSPVNGYVMVRNVVDDQHVMEGTVIYEVANLDGLWVTLEAYEEDIGWISTGDRIEFRIRSNPGRTYEATVDYIDPVFNAQSRTIRLRADIDNNDQQLRPDMLVTGILHAEQREEKLMVPASAVLWTGPRSLVYVKDTGAETPRFMVREVDLGLRSGDYFVIEDGLEEGEQVVFNGTFRIDSEFQLADRFSMMNRQPGTGGVPAGHQHGEREDRTHTRDAEDLSVGVSDDFRAEFTDMIRVYLDLKDALVESDFNEASRLSAGLVSELESIGEHRNRGDAHNAWMDVYGNLMGHLQPMADAGSIEEIRTQFRTVSDLLVNAVKSFGIDGVVYHQYCPMAFDDEGGYWLSSEEEIQNPYLPETMLMCGEVIERIEQP
jgi:membrane fusion protein, copper/silver efflux system